MFWDKKKLEEQRKKRLVEDEQRRRLGVQLKKKKKLQKKLKQQRAEEEDEERAARDEAEAAKEKQSTEKKVFVPPTLNRGFGMDLGGKGIVEKMMQPNGAGSKEAKKEDTKTSKGWSPHGGDEPEGTGGSGTSNIPKLPRPF
jgi:hypothetical protein